jgi:sporadic carbohydrate cluster protein (TIGR04323 family)
MNKIFGYVTSRPFGPYVMPVPAQNSCLREYSANRNYQYVLPQLEHKFDNCFMQLFGTIKNAGVGGNIVMYSFEIINEAKNEKLSKIIDAFCDTDISVHFVLENRILRTAAEYKEMEKVYKLVFQLRGN